MDTRGTSKLSLGYSKHKVKFKDENKQKVKVNPSQQEKSAHTFSGNIEMDLVIAKIGDFFSGFMEVPAPLGSFTTWPAGILVSVELFFLKRRSSFRTIKTSPQVTSTFLTNMPASL